MSNDYGLAVTTYCSVLENLDTSFEIKQSYSFPERHMFSFADFTRVHNKIVEQIDQEIGNINIAQSSIVSKNKKWHDDLELRAQMALLQRKKGLLSEMEHDLNDALLKLKEFSEL